ncbi:hypothetical protein DL240_05005 [Lujinxingia litoralis]|uniref:Outer membrane protein beta-barrel domain-containing protein n=1 Tax=Lujinxingia litoralis TaxID=2211119 RepID=A0A328C8N4_9DELT|nr:hypothetical protein [Lujinxingia litoralis]RAL23522.1 hypothetical protein DL240_05005 [Lujinxingia litoralis]
MLLSPPTLASEEASEERPFNGSFSEWSLRGSLGSAAPTLSEGLGGELAFRTSFPLYLGDTRLSYRYTRLGPQIPRPVHALHLGVNLHPFYLALLSEGLVSHVLASLHLELGLGPQLARADDETRLGFAGSVGAGFDIPLSRANRGRGLWLSTTYRRTWTTLRLAPGLPRAHEHAALLGLSWRTNGVIF